MEEGEADAVFSVKQTEERSKFLYYSSEPIGFERSVILALKGSGIKVNSLDDLKGSMVGTVRGYAPGLILEDYPGIKVVECNNEAHLGKMLAKGRFSLAVGFEINIKYFSKLAGIDVETIYVLEEGQSYIGFSKKAIKDKSLPEKFGKILRTLKEGGVIRQIESKYF
jgi:ABC-type amino acid transport substrate-binding protein